MKKITSDKLNQSIKQVVWTNSKGQKQISYYLKYTFNSKRRSIKIGNAAAPIQTVRKIASELQAKMLLDTSFDPLAKNDKQKRTTDEVFAKYQQQLEMNNRKTIQEYVRLYEKDIKPGFGHLPIDTISRGDVKSWFDELSLRSKYTANRCLTILKTVFEIAIDYEYLETNPASRIKKHAEVKRERFYSPEEKILIFQELFRRLEEDNSLLHSVSFILVLIFSGARKSELASATWDDWHGDYIELKEHKTDRDGKTRKIWLNSQSRSVIQTLQGEKKKKTIFGIKNPKRLWNSVKLACKEFAPNIDKIRLHDLRHSFGTVANSASVDFLQTGELMGHQSLSMMKRYQHIEDKTSRENIEKIGDEILKEIDLPTTFQ
jgi:integrase